MTKLEEIQLMLIKAVLKNTHFLMMHDINYNTTSSVLNGGTVMDYLEENPKLYSILGVHANTKRPDDPNEDPEGDDCEMCLYDSSAKLVNQTRPLPYDLGNHIVKVMNQAPLTYGEICKRIDNVLENKTVKAN